MTITKISTNVQALMANMSQFVTVIPHPPTQDSDFEGYPSVAHYYPSTTSEYATVTQNRRTHEYLVEVYLVVSKTTSETDKFAQMYALVDAVLDTLDQSVDLSSAALSLTPACDLMRPASCDLTPIVTNEGLGLMATIKLECTADISFR